jgi:AAA domain
MEPIDFAEPEPRGKSNGRVTEPAPYRVLNTAEIFAPLPPLSYLVEKIGLVGGSGPPHLIAGYGYSGKTLAVQSLALSLVAGCLVWAFYPAREQRRVVHIDYEQGERLTRARYQRLACGMQLDPEAWGDALRLIVKPRFALAAPDRGFWLELMQGTDLIIVDALKGATPGVDENDSRIREPLDLLGDLSEQTGCRALVLHHARKPPEGGAEGGRYSVRGSSAIFDATDSAYVFSAQKGDGASKVEHERAKSHGETIEDFALSFADVEHDGDPKAGLIVRVYGAELLAEKREAAALERERKRAALDGKKICELLAQNSDGLATMALRNRARLSGRRFELAIAELGDAVGSVDERRGSARRSTFYYLREHMPDTGHGAGDGGHEVRVPPSEKMADAIRESPRSSPEGGATGSRTSAT